MVAAFQSKQHNEDDIAESDGDEYDTDSVTLEESEDEMDKIEEGASSKVDNFDIFGKDHQEAFVGWRHSGCFVHTLAIVKKVKKSCRATKRLIQLAGKKASKKLSNPMVFVISSHVICLK